MGPACLVIAILVLATSIAFCAFASFFFFSDQPALAERAIRQALIPWVESSTLSPADKRMILTDLEETIGKISSRTLTSKQLTRLKSVLEDNPALLWGNVQGVMASAKEAGLSDIEIEGGTRVTQRLMRAVAERKLGRNDLVYALEPCCHTRPDGQGLEINTPITDKQIRDFLGRAEKFVDGVKIPNEPFEKTPPDVFRGLIEEALSVK